MGWRADLLEVPAQLVEHLSPERRQKLVPDDLLRVLSHVGELWRHDDPERPRRQRLKQGGVAFEELPEVIERRVGDYVHDDAAAREVDADR